MLVSNMRNNTASKFTVPVECSETKNKFTVEIIQDINTDHDSISENAKQLVKRAIGISECKVISDYFKRDSISQVKLEREPEVRINGIPVPQEIVSKSYVM